jgi:hypothetical protein
MYSLICDGKTILVVDSFGLAITQAMSESLIDGGASIDDDFGRQIKGRIVSVWSGEIEQGQGVVKHASYVCGRIW